MAGCRACDFNPMTMRSRIVIEKKTQVQTNTGGFTTSWATFATVWAKAEEKHSDERLISQRISSVDIHNFVIRYIPGLTEAMRIQHRGLQLQIKSIIFVDGLKNFISIKAVEEGEGT